jgi:glycine betaine/proline transport system substrate-binding protein
MWTISLPILFILLWPLSCIAACPLDRSINVAGLDYDSARFSSEVLATILRAGFTCEVSITYNSLNDQIDAVKRGDADLIMEIWLDDVSTYWSDAQQEGVVTLLGTNFASADEGWFVPRYLVEGPNASVPSLRSVADLPRYKDLFHGEFLNCPVGWNCNKINIKKLGAYGLNKAYRSVNADNDADMVSRVTQAYLNRSAILFYAWHPDMILSKYDFVQLREPVFDINIWGELNRSDNPTVACEYPQSAVMIGANKRFIDNYPALRELLVRWRLSNEDIVDAITDAHTAGKTMKQVAETFVRLRADVWMPWVSESIASTIQTNLHSDIRHE